ncbi:claudin-4-like [Neoarius graeffei]|uniref:claudin-4-like n=1 Tax=Neoarius graeffei TaxID=443677 RepID=UPI00298CB763|nr:claudin-4-like [Neoarius graeffei]
MGRQLLAAFLALVGFMGTILIAALPMWKMSAFIGSNIVTAQVFYEGLWMNCVLQSTGHMQCKAYYSILALPQYLQATQALICVSLAVAVFGIGLMVVGARCTKFFRDDWNKKAMIGIIAGVVYIIAGILCLIAVSWSAYTIIQSFYNPQDISARKGEMGACIYIGWVAGFLLVLGGGLFISTYSNSYFVYINRAIENSKPLPKGYSTMVSQKLQLVGLVLALVGFVGTILICGLPAWKTSAFIGANLVIFQVFWEGLWMDCVVQTTGQMQCKVYDSLLILPVHLQAARGLIIAAIIVGIIGIIITVIGGKCTNFVQDESTKAKIVMASGIIFIITGILVLIPVCWTTNAVVRRFYNPAVMDGRKRELGPCLYISFVSAALLIAGGALLCTSCPPKDDTDYHVKYSQARSSVSSNKVYV